VKKRALLWAVSRRAGEPESRGAGEPHPAVFFQREGGVRLSIFPRSSFIDILLILVVNEAVGAYPALR